MSLAKRNAFSRASLITAISIGSMLEWYEFSIYAYLTPVLGKIFSPTFSFQGTMNILLIFAIGFLARPLGGIFFGELGDRYGRKKALLLSIILIIFPTLVIGFLPGFTKIGVMAPILLAIMRMLQSFPAGGETPGAICYLIESASTPSQKAYMGSWTYFGSQMGFLFAILECLFMEKMLSQQQILDWGWRVSFFLAAFIGLFGLKLRYKLKETPLFEALQKNRAVVSIPFKKAFSKHKRNLLIGIFLPALSLAGCYLAFVFPGAYFEEILGLKHTDNLIHMALLLIVSTSLLPVFGKFLNKIPIKFMFLSSAIGIILFSYPIYYFASEGYFAIAMIFEMIVMILLSYHFALIPSLLSWLFPTEIRFTSLGLSYNISNSLIGGAAPFIGLLLFKVTNNPTIPSLIYAASALSSIGAFLIVIKDKSFKIS